MTFHFAEAAANFLTNPALDPIAKIPEYKACAVRVERMERPGGCRVLSQGGNRLDRTFEPAQSFGYMGSRTAWCIYHAVREPRLRQHRMPIR